MPAEYCPLKKIEDHIYARAGKRGTTYKIIIGGVPLVTTKTLEAARRRRDAELAQNPPGTRQKRPQGTGGYYRRLSGRFTVMLSGRSLGTVDTPEEAEKLIREHQASARREWRSGHHGSVLRTTVIV